MPSFDMVIDVIYDIDHHVKYIKGDKTKSPLTFFVVVWGFHTPTQTHLSCFGGFGDDCASSPNPPQTSRIGLIGESFSPIKPINNLRLREVMLVTSLSLKL